MAPQKKKIKIVNEERKAAKDAKKNSAVEGQSRVKKTLDDGRKRMDERRAKQENLKNRIEKATQEEKEALEAQLRVVEGQISSDKKEVEDAEAEELRLKKEEENADMLDVEDEMEVDVDENPDDLKESTESINPVEFAAKLMKGLSISDRNEDIDLTQDVQLRNTQAVVCYKSGFGNPVIVVDCEFPGFPIYRIRKDIEVPDHCPNLMKWRRGGTFKNQVTEAKWTGKDIKDVLGIAIEVPVGFEENPEDLVHLIQRPSKRKRKALKKKGKPIPRQPDVQLLVEWKTGIIAPGETEKRFNSWESRSSCRTLWRKKGAADGVLVKVAKNMEVGYRRAGGKHSSEERSLSPIVLPRDTPGSDDELESDVSGTDEEEDTDDEEEEKKKKKKKDKKEKNLKKKKKKEEDDDEEDDENDDDEDDEDDEDDDDDDEYDDEEEKKKKKKGKEKRAKTGKSIYGIQEAIRHQEEKKRKEREKEKETKEKRHKKGKKGEEKEKKTKKKGKRGEENVKEEEDDGVGGFDESEYKAASDEYELRFRARKRIAKGVELTAKQEADLIEGFEHLWKKRLAEL